ncbi:hypothetical protein [Chondromyces apiculatus]|uniref:Uncharacterized protein n=1 Tax=Chondromyces apiculatus DSM 436 TaxID=1192034 RepID=A0A017SXI5_9BACT|nr:hypothetical protein [Chondromyces apiculatus]EYF01663.1 Hypothetical protein CAP_7868 [Chondromyces apiculatus DSM 436]
MATENASGAGVQSRGRRVASAGARGLAGVGMLLLACGAAACGGEEDGGTGSLRVRVSGEGAARDGYPYVEQGVEIRFGDGWSIAFRKYLVSFGDIEVAGLDGEVGSASGARYVADLHTGDPTAEEIEGLAARRWDSVSFSVVEAGEESVALEGVSGEDLSLMKAGGFTFYIDGEATHAERGRFDFTWGIVNPTRNRNCTNGLDGTDGVIVRPSATTEAELTFHVDHLFWDTLGAEQSQLRFDPMWGANKDGDTTITFQELAGQRLADLTDPEGEPLRDEAGQALVYNPGSIPLPDKNLQEFVRVSAASQAHLNGLGLCSVQALKR